MMQDTGTTGESKTTNTTDAAADRKEHTITYEAPVTIPADTWARIYERVRQGIRQGKDPEFAWADAVNEYIQVIPVPVIGGEECRLEDVPTDVGEVDATATLDYDASPERPLSIDVTIPGGVIDDDDLDDVLEAVSINARIDE